MKTYKQIPTHPQFEICDEETLDRCIRTVDTKEYLNVYINNCGYPRTTLRKKFGGNGKQYLIHRLVCETYIGPIPEGMEIDHVNRNVEDFRHTNLKICSHVENMNNRLTLKYRNKLTQQRFKKKKIVLQLDKDTGETLNEYIGVREAGLRTGIRHICECCKGKYKQAGGYVWKYKELSV